MRFVSRLTVCVTVYKLVVLKWMKIVAWYGCRHTHMCNLKLKRNTVTDSCARTRNNSWGGIELDGTAHKGESWKSFIISRQLISNVYQLFLLRHMPCIAFVTHKKWSPPPTKGTPQLIHAWVVYCMYISWYIVLYGSFLV